MPVIKINYYKHYQIKVFFLQACTFFLSLMFSSLQAFSCFFHSSTFVVLSCNAAVSLALLFFSVCSSVSHFLALAELSKRQDKINTLSRLILHDILFKNQRQGRKAFLKIYNERHSSFKGVGRGNGENGLKACFNQQRSQSRSHNWNGKRAYHQVKNNNKSELGEIISF